MALFFGSRGGEFLRTPSQAVSAFGLDQDYFVKNYPFHKFQFAVRFNINPATGVNLDVDSLSSVTDSVKLPSVGIDTEEANEYNRSRLIHTKLNFGECNIVIYDVADGETLRMWQEYYNYHYLDGIAGGKEFGYDTSTAENNNTRYFFDSIEIVQMHAQQTLTTVLINPRIVNFEPDTYQYSNIEELGRLTFTVKPEYVEYYVDNQPLSEDILDRLRGGNRNIGSEIFRAIGSIAQNRITGGRSGSTARQAGNTLLNNLAADYAAGPAANDITRTIRNSVTQNILDSVKGTSSRQPASTSALDTFGRLVPSLTQSVLSSVTARNQNRLDIRSTAGKKLPFGNIISGKEQGGDD